MRGVKKRTKAKRCRMPIKIAKHCRLTAEPKDGTRILTMRFWPRGCEKNQFDTWMKELAPSIELLNWCRDQEKSEPPVDPQIYFETWRDRYISEMEKQRETITDLRARHESGQTLTLLCACHDPAKCHRSILQDLILEGSEVP